jgi:hypothetical protein
MPNPAAFDPAQRPAAEGAHHSHMVEPAKPPESQRVPCEVCLKEVPKSEAEMAEARDYVAYFCGLECYDKWRRERAEADTKIKVDCYAGYLILDRWAGPDQRYFKVQADDGRTLVLRHDTTSGNWELR